MSDAAYRLWTLSWSYCADVPEPTGFIEEGEALAFARTHRKTQAVIDEVVDKAGWEKVPTGYLIHDFEKHLPKKSTEKVRAWREEKRRKLAAAKAQPQSNPDVTVAQPLQAPVETTGNGSSHGRGFPVPDPVPVPEAPPTPSRSNGVLSDAVKDPATELGLAMHELLGRVLSTQDLIECQLALNQYAYLTAAELVDRAHRHLEHCRSQDPPLPTPRTVAGFADTWRRENDHRADQGMSKAERVASHRSTGMTSVGQLLKEAIP